MKGWNVCMVFYFIFIFFFMVSPTIDITEDDKAQFMEIKIQINKLVGLRMLATA